MKGNILQVQFAKASIELANGGRTIIVDLQPYDTHRYGFGDCFVHTEIPGTFGLVLNKQILQCELKCSKCQKCGLYCNEQHCFISCDTIWRIRVE